MYLVGRIQGEIGQCVIRLEEERRNKPIGSRLSRLQSNFLLTSEIFLNV